MNKAKFYQNISTYFSHAVRGYACGAKNGLYISGTGIPNYTLLLLTQFYGDKEVSLWLSNVDSVPKAEIRIAEAATAASKANATDLDRLVTIPFSEYLLSFGLDANEQDVLNAWHQHAKAVADPDLASFIEAFVRETFDCNRNS